MRSISTAVFACHSAACRPPRSGGTGGSLKGGPGGSPPDAYDDGPRLSSTKVMQAIKRDDEDTPEAMKRRVNEELSTGLLKSKEGMRLIDELLNDPQMRRGVTGANDYLIESITRQLPVAAEGAMSSLSVGEVVRTFIHKVQNTDPEDLSMVSIRMLDVAGYDRFGTLPASADEWMARVVARAFVDDWAGSAMNRLSGAAQIAASQRDGTDVSWVRDEMGITPSPWAVKMATVLNDIEYQNTQAFLKRTLGAKGTIRLYRGATNYRLDGPQKVEVQSNPLSSWSTSHETASGFSSGGAIVVMDVPISMVQSTPFTGRGCLDESEFILIGRPSTAFVTTSSDEATSLEGSY